MQGFNMGRYIPPDQEGLTGANKLHNKHPLGARARHLQTKGALIVRFEMPFAVWCTTCKPHETIIGQGVRFNAEKKKVGTYYSTPVYSFRMKHGACGGWIEIRTDPQNTAYVVTEGGRKRDTGEDKDREGGAGGGEIVVGRSAGDKEDAFARLEGKVEDKRVAETERSRILELQRRQARDWEDPYENSRRLRRSFRVERKGLERAEAQRDAIRDKMSLGIEIVDENEEDRLRAGMVDYGVDSAGQSALRARPMFDTKAQKNTSATESDAHGKTRRAKRPKAADLLAQRKAAFRNELTGNTRAVVDPFLNHAQETTWQPETKRRKVIPQARVVVAKENDDENHNAGIDLVNESVQNSAAATISAGSPAVPTMLVDYGSDSD